MRHRHTVHTNAVRLVAALAALGSLAAAANAQPAPLPPPGNAAAPPPPPRAACGGPAPRRPGPVPGLPPPPDTGPRSAAGGPPAFLGTVVAARPYRVQIRTPDRRDVNLDLRKGTVINPLGSTLSPGMRVAVRGVREADDAIAASEVDVCVTPPGPRSQAAMPAPPKPHAAPPAAPMPPTPPQR